MTTELYYLTLSALMTTVLWAPYIVNGIAVRGLPIMLGGAPKESTVLLSPWARRLLAAHTNAVENLVIFAALVLVAHAISVSTPITAAAAAVYFWARVAHYLIYGLGISVLRTAAFTVAWMAQLVIGWQILGAVA